MPKGAITQYIDVAQVVLYFFWAFFFYLIYWLRREDKREGYPLTYERVDTAPYLNFPSIPPAKTFMLPHGGTVNAPRGVDPQPDLKAQPIAPWPGAPLEPTGDPMVDGVGPAAFALRADTPDLNLEGQPKIVPLRAATGHKAFSLSPRDPDPRGMAVIGLDRAVAGKVTDVWIDTSEVIIRYLEVQTTGGATVLVPSTFAVIDGSRKQVKVDAILASQFAKVPAVKTPNQVTLLEEDRITAYFGGGKLYATPRRREALL